MAEERVVDRVTGGAGFIGSALTAALAAAGRRVIVLDDLAGEAYARSWTPRIALAGGLDSLIAWYRSLGVSPQALLAEEVVQNWLPTPPETVARRRA